LGSIIHFSSKLKTFKKTLLSAEKLCRADSYRIQSTPNMFVTEILLMECAQIMFLSRIAKPGEKSDAMDQLSLLWIGNRFLFPLALMFPFPFSPGRAAFRCCRSFFPFGSKSSPWTMDMPDSLLNSTDEIPNESQKV
jgi:hypothetical protein